ncbi:TetR family transcriptional regulator [Brevibacterium casei]|uniref:Transcriptional regulator, TetR family n=2 Tax=Brevibacterium casei TaxID=33889 RepID=A0A2H1HWM4_9MICO|nr:TetR family transcriptional regulator [Brevibacterium casei]SMX67282.1 transcriptional regulator, TetR family [Brevibacterium casei CIP 102111]MCT1550814.1 TetR family transcriptional regulator [Brevibacterium casei]MCT1559109.1 TetR family transcriptional regulator [Brevibacterium casei]MCT2206966.1 TetR family transcriptional regulator [Brevibacterium casei]QPR41109.1 TetR family transcriptional regulator [Brevibacterium casei]
MLGGKEAADGDQAGLGTRVRAAIRRAGINHSEVARSIGLEPSKLSKSLAGTRKFRVEEITRIAEITDVTTDWLTRGQGEGPPRRTITSVPADSVTPVGSGSEPTLSAGARDHASPANVGIGPTAVGDDADETWMSKGTRNRRRIVEVAWELYADRGIESVRVHDIAEASGLSVSAINYHFRTKTQLLEAALRYSLEIIATARDLLEPDDPVEVLRRFARVHAGVDPTVRRVWSIWIQSWARAVVDERSRLNLTAVYGEWLELVTGVIVAGQRTGQMRAGNTDLMVKSLSTFIDGLGIARSARQMTISDDDARLMIESFLAAHILAPESPPSPEATAPQPPSRPSRDAASQEEGT